MESNSNADAKARELEEEFVAVLSIEDEPGRVAQVLELAPRLPPALLDQVLDKAPSIQNEVERGRAIGGVAAYLTPTQLDKALVLISQIYLVNSRIEAVGQIAPFVSQDRRNEIIETIASESVAQVRLKGWLGMVPFLPIEKKEEAITTALTLPEIDRAEALVKLAPHLPPQWKMKALASVNSMSAFEPKVRALCGLIPVLPKREKAAALNEALALSRSLLPIQRTDAVISLLPHLPAELRPGLLDGLRELARSSVPWFDRVQIFLRLSQTSQEAEEKYGLLLEALKLVKEIPNETDRSQALIMLAAFIPTNMRQSLLEVARTISDQEIRSKLLIELDSILTQEPVEELRPTPTPSEAANVDPVPAAAGLKTSGETPTALASDTTPPPLEGVPASGRDPGSAKPPTTGPLPEPELKRPQSKAARKRTPKTEAPEIQPTPEPDKDFEPIGVKTYLHSDKWTLDDQLNYSLYADAIAEFIRHPDTQPPLAIGILAPWGQGKTTLMKLIQDKLEKKAKEDAAKEPAKPAAPDLKQDSQSVTPTKDKLNGQRQPGQTHFRFADLKEWLRNPTYYPQVKTLNYPTVWFNAWKYQNSEQLWAAMAHVILNELVKQIDTPWNQENFWLALQAERIDFTAIRQDIHRVIFERIAPWVIVWTSVGALGIMAFVLGLASGIYLLSKAGVVTFGLSSFIAVAQWLWAKTKVNQKPLEGKFAKYVRQPTYEGKLGVFHEVEQDVRRVFKLLVSKDQPVVIFIDDLDRCSPGTVAQVIEAMNLFLSADFPDCYFIVGMDAQVVAASMEVAYENLDKKLKSVTRSYGSLGWYFMDKFIQLQFHIPNLNRDQRHGYLAKLFGHEIGLPKDAEATEAELDKIQNEFNQVIKSDVLKPEQLAQQAKKIAKLRWKRPEQWQKRSESLIETGAKQLSDNSPALQKYLDDYKDLLGSSPRSIKRFANLYRFYSLTQLSRQSQGLEASSPSALARWLVIMLRWPQLVRWIQWESETKFISATDAREKAAALEDQLNATKTYEAWLKHLEQNDPTQGEWLRDKHLYEFLKLPVATDKKLSAAVQNGVW